MKKSLLGSITLVALSVGGSAWAADMPVKVRPVVPAWAWSGCYVGLNVGYANARFRKSDVVRITPNPVTFADFDFDDDGAAGGAQIGCNWQTGQTVFGIETDIQVTSIEARRYFDNAFFNVPDPDLDTEVRSSLRYFGTVRGRLGWTVTPTTLLYVTGGFAYGQDRSSLNFPTAAGAPTTFYASDSQTHFGYAVGVGAEAKIAQNFTAKIEYLYADLGSKEYFLECRCADNIRWDQRVDFHTVRIGLNYQFNWYETVVAKY
jgi:outer membrane immunogenic protein